jgi:hypothetical protein
MRALAILLLAGVLCVVAATTTARASTGLQPGIAKLTSAQAHALRTSGEWHPGCPVAPSHLRLVTARYYGFDHHFHLGQIVVNEAVAPQVVRAFRKLFMLRFPIRRMSFAAAYGRHRNWNDLTASFECRNAAASPCSGKGGTMKTWSMHAYGEAVDLDPRENPYVGCGMTRDKTALSYIKRSNVRPGMVTTAIYRRTFGAVGWGWGGAWSGSTKDYMHFSVNGH